MKRFFRTPKGLLIIVLALLTPIAAWHSGVALVLPGVPAASIAAMLVDAPILRRRDAAWAFPSGAGTGMLVATVLSPHELWQIAGVTAVAGVLSKYVARTRSANVFNPAARAAAIPATA